MHGTFDGRATFEPLAGMQQKLAYLEDGMATLSPTQPAIPAFKRLLWDCSITPAQVYFDESQDRDPAAVVSSARHFHSIDLDADGMSDPPTFDHPCCARTSR